MYVVLVLKENMTRILYKFSHFCKDIVYSFIDLKKKVHKDTGVTNYTPKKKILMISLICLIFHTFCPFVASFRGEYH